MDPLEAGSGAVEPSWDWELLRRASLLEARRVLRDPHEAEDATQEAMARAWRQRHSCRERAAPKAWLRSITRNEALRLIERKAAAPQAELPSEERAGAASAESLEDLLVERLSVWAALRALAPSERELVTLRYLMDLSQPEIAQRLGVPEATIRVRLHRIRKRLRPLFHERRGEP